MLKIRLVLPLFLLISLAARTSPADQGIPLLAHGGSAEWNARVTGLAARDACSSSGFHGDRDVIDILREDRSIWR